MNLKYLKPTTLIAAGGILAGAMGLPAMADPDNKMLMMDGGGMLTTDAKPGAGNPLDHVYSGWRFRMAETQALQLDDFENPAFPAVDTGAGLSAGAYVLSENYLFTEEAFDTDLGLLKPGGVLFVYKMRLQLTRVLTTAIAALRRAGAEDPAV